MLSEQQNLSTARVLIVDGHALAYKMFYALPEMKSPTGAPTNAIFGFIKSLRRIVEEHRPTHGVVVWDGGLSPQRLALLPEYKGQRPPMPDAFRFQLSPLQEWVPLYGWQSLCHAQVEADDLIGTLATDCEKCGAEVIILTLDKDFMQIVSPKIHLLRMRGGVEQKVDPEAVKSQTGVIPEQIVDWLSLIGDVSDNIDGIPGVGPKTAAKLLNQFGTIVAIYRNMERVEPKRLRGAFIEKRSLLKRNQKLIRLTPLPQYSLPVEQLRIKNPRNDAMTDFLEKWGLKSLLREQQSLPPQAPMVQAELF